MPQPIETDSFYSELVSGISGINSDVSSIIGSSSTYGVHTQIFETEYETNTFAANLIDLLPQSMGRHSPIIKYPDPRINAVLQDRVNNLVSYFIEASKLARLTGGAAILIGGVGQLHEPLNTYIKEPLFYNILEGGSQGELEIYKVDKDPRSQTYLKPLYYRLRHSKNAVVHGSRVLPFYGIKPLTKRQFRRSKYWGLPVLIRCYDALKNLDKTDSAIAATVDKFSRIVLQIEDFNRLSRTQEGRDLLRERTKQINFGWKVHKTLILQLSEKIDTLVTDYEGIVNAANHVKKTLASKTDIPYSKLFNSSPSKSGLSGGKSDSESVDRGDERQWSDYVGTKQVNDWNPNWYRLIDYHLLTLGVRDSQKYEIEHPSILQMSESEKAAIEKLKAETAQIYIGTQSVTPQNVAKALKDDISLGSTVDVTLVLNEPLKPVLPMTNSNGLKPPMIPGKESLMLEGEAITPGIIGDDIKDSLAVDDGNRAKRKLKWNGFVVALQYFPFDLRHGKMLLCGYGYFEKTLGADNMAADVYVGTRLHLDKIYAIEQWIDGKFDEIKYVIGVNSPMEARNLYTAVMPQEFIGMLYEVSIRKLYELRNDYTAKYGSKAPILVDNEGIEVKGELTPSSAIKESLKVSEKDITTVDENREKIYPSDLQGIIDPQ